MTDNKQQHTDRPALDLNTLKAELRGFTGTSCYFRHFLGLHYTEGIQYMAERAGAFWLIDAIASWQPQASRIDREFQVWELTVNEDCTAVLAFYRDSGQPVQIRQEIPYTDFPKGQIRLFVENGVLLLSSEH